MKFKSLILFSWLILFTSPSFSQSTVLNKGIGGNNSYDLIKRLNKDVLSESPDLVIMMVGTNDMINLKKTVAYPSFKKNIQTIIDSLVKNNIEIVLMTPLPVDTGYVFQRHNRDLFDQDLNIKIDSAGKIVKSIATDNGLYFIDLNRLFKIVGSPNRDINSLIINKENSGIEDGVHPTRDGYLLIAETVFSFLKNAALLESKLKIICFGDSITYGSYMEGAGTNTGATYPAFLSSLILGDK